MSVYYDRPMYGFTDQHEFSAEPEVWRQLDYPAYMHHVPQDMYFVDPMRLSQPLSVEMATIQAQPSVDSYGYATMMSSAVKRTHLDAHHSFKGASPVDINHVQHGNFGHKIGSNLTRSRMPPTPPESPLSRSTMDETFVPTTAVPASKPNSNPSRYYCSHQDCADPVTGMSTKSFSRNADVVRHERSQHNEAEKLDCPRRNCSRKGKNGFTRLDHLMEHRRGYHGEAIPKRQRSSMSSSRRASDLSSRA